MHSFSEVFNLEDYSSNLLLPNLFEIQYDVQLANAQKSPKHPHWASTPIHAAVRLFYRLCFRTEPSAHLTKIDSTELVVDSPAEV